MKKRLISLYRKCFGTTKPPQQETTPLVINVYSQPHVLQQRMKEGHLTHGDRIKANISPIRIENAFNKVTMYFCPLQAIEVCDKIETGDGGPIPAEAIIKGFVVPKNIKPGLYTLNNVELFSNGTMQVIAGKDTVFEPISNPHVGYVASERPAYTTYSSEAIRQQQARRDSYMF